MNQQTHNVLCQILAELRCLEIQVDPTPANCAPRISSATGATPALTQVHQLDSHNPTCCPIVVTTSIGVFRVPGGAAHSFKVECPFDVTAVAFDGGPSDECDLGSVTLTGVRVQ